MVEFFHGTGFFSIHDVYIGLHGPIAGMPGPFHDYAGRDTQRKRLHDKGPAAGVCTDPLPFMEEEVFPLAAPVLGNPYVIVQAGHPAQYLQTLVHGLVGAAGERLSIRDKNIFVFPYDFIRYFIQFNGNAVSGLYRRHLKVIPFDIAFSEVPCVRIAETGKTAEEKNIPYPFQIPARQL